MVRTMIKSFRELVIWQRSIEFTEEIYKITRILPREETYGLISQLRRAAVSIPSNIAEGYSRASRNDYLNFLSMAMGSLAEVQTQLLICERIGYISNETLLPAMGLADEIGKMGHTIIRKLSVSNS